MYFRFGEGIRNVNWKCHTNPFLPSVLLIKRLSMRSTFSSLSILFYTKYVRSPFLRQYFLRCTFLVKRRSHALGFTFLRRKINELYFEGFYFYAMRSFGEWNVTPNISVPFFDQYLYKVIFLCRGSVHNTT